MESLGHIVSPFSVASSLNLNKDSVRKVMSSLYKEGKLDRPFHGYYNLKPRYGVGSRFSEVCLRIQNVRGRALAVSGVVSGKGVLEGESYRVIIQFGEKRGKVSYSVGCGLGLDLVGFDLVHDMVVRECEARGLDIPKDAWEIRCEYLTDLTGIQLEGVECMTVRDFRGNFEKYYNKPGVRREVRSNYQGVNVSELRTLLDKGIEASGLQYQMNMLQREMLEIKETLKFHNRVFYDLKQAFLDWSGGSSYE